MMPERIRMAIVAGLLVVGTTAEAQETTGQLQGRAVDLEGRPVPYVNVLVTGPALQGARGCLGTKNGTFVLPALPIGTYNVRISHVGHQGETREDVRVLLGQTTSLGDVALRPRELETEKVVVVGKAPLLDPTTTEIGGVLNAETYATLPIDRDYRSIAVLLPNVNASFLGDETNYAGGTGMDNRYFIDGIDVTDPFRGITGTRLPYNFVEEVEVRTGGYEAEHRSSLGGVVNAVTYSGSNQLTGQAFGYFVNNQFSGDVRESFSDPGKGGFAYYDVGFGLGGPIKKDVLWYHAAYNPTFALDEVEIPGWGLYDDRSTTHSFAGKLTWRTHPRNTLVLTVLGDPTVRRAVYDPMHAFPAPLALESPDAVLQDQRTGSVHANLDDLFVLRDDLLVQASLSWARAMNRFAPATDAGAGEPLFIDMRTRTWSAGQMQDVENRTTVVIAGLKGTWWQGSHELKAGLEYKDASTKSRGDAWNLLLCFSDSLYLWSRSLYGGTVANRIGSLFLQDSWLALPSLRLNAGVRWDGLWMIDSNGDAAQTMLDGWQPRVGFVWRPGKKDVQKVSGSYGRFYHDLATYATAANYSDEVGLSWVTFDHDPRSEPGALDSVPALAILPEVDDLQGQHYDEITLGYERCVSSGAKLGARGIHRRMHRAFQGGIDPVTGIWFLGNPGYGIMSAWPRAKHDFTALEISWQQELQDRLSLLASYALSRAYGNYSGLYISDFEYEAPNDNGAFQYVDMLTNAEGLLPNNRTHAFKLAGSYRFTPRFTLGLIAIVMSGTPLSEFGRSATHGLELFLRQRGTAGRTPWIWDLSLRTDYLLPIGTAAGLRPRVTLDFLHIASQREAVDFDQLHYGAVDAAGNPSNPSPTYLMPTRYQPPMALRMGLELGF